MSENTSSPSQKGRIFISYRRADSEGYAGRIYDRLAPHFGDDAIFMDVDDIPAGVDFVKYLENEVQSCDVLIALIGKQWLNVEDEHGLRRLDNPNDFVRIEIGTALKRDIRVIPVLLGGTQMPNISDLPENLQSLTRRNGLLVYHHSFHADTNRLIKHLENALGAAEKAAQEKAEKGAAEKARLKAEEEERQRIAKEKAEREAAEKAAPKNRLETEEKLRQKAAKEKVEREAAEKVVREKAEKEAVEKARLKTEEEERQRIAKEKAEREAAEKASLEKELWLDRLYTEGLAAFYTDDRDKATQRFQTILKEQPDNKNVTKKLIEIERQKESAEKAARVKAEREAAEKVARERAEKEAAEKARLAAEEKARQKAEREAAERVSHEKAEKEATEKAAREKAKKEAAERGRRSSGFSGIEIVVIVIVFGCVAAVLTLLFSSFEKPEVTVTPTITIVIPPTKAITPTPTKTKVPTLTPTPTLTLVPQGSILLQEDFEDNAVSNDWSSAYTIQKDSNGNHYWLATSTGAEYPSAWYFADGTDDWKNYAFEVRIKFIKEGGIFIGSYAYPNAVSSFFVSFITSDGYVRLVEYNLPTFGWRVIDGTEKKSLITRNKWYLVRFEVQDGQLSTYVDNKLVTNTNIPQPTASESGTVGFYIGKDDEVHIDDIKVWQLK